jgi:hypothetical protein
MRDAETTETSAIIVSKPLITWNIKISPKTETTRKRDGNECGLALWWRGGLGSSVAHSNVLQLGTSHLPIERRRAQTAKATAAFPPIAQRSITGGTNWARRYCALPPQERARIIARCVIGWYRYDAKRRGLPTPVFHSYEPVVDDDGKLQAKPNTMRVMTEAEIEAI